MATIELTNPSYYQGGTEVSGGAVGNEKPNGNLVRRVARYTFTSPLEGAQNVSSTFYIGGLDEGLHIPLRFYIGTSSDSHINAGSNSEYIGELIESTFEGWVTFTGNANIILIPNQTYYLWVFPASDTFGLYYWNNNYYTSHMETSGYVGVVQIDDGLYLPCIDNGTSWDLHIPYIDNSTSWDLCT